MRGDRWHSPRIPWFPDVVRPGARWLVRLPLGTEAAEQRRKSVTWASESGILSAWGGAFRWLRELTAREPLTRMARTGIDTDGPCAQETDRTRRPGEPSVRELGWGADSEGY
jgi:hypothetical protein